MKKIIILVFFAVYSMQAQADARTDKVETLMKTLGLVEMFEQRIQMSKVRNEQIGKQAIKQILEGLNPPAEMQKKMTKTFLAYMKKVESPWTSDEIVKVWVKYYGANFSEKELDQLIQFYSSPLGKKDVNESKKAMANFSQEFQEKGDKIRTKALGEYVTDLKQIIKECTDCTKKVTITP
ncbi:MAG: DUF2059 domain-containing protein [Methylococcales bacterium]|nr:DUF2059 domain-containing protein [Methylococcales bacterium]MCK5926207.1 DUF2059 domain-containing protein [Methylococcales bacterium]